MHRIVSTWSCVKTDAGVVSLDQSHLLWWLRCPCEYISLFLSVIRWRMQEEDVIQYRKKMENLTCVDNDRTVIWKLYFDVRWSSYNEPWPWHRDPIIMMLANHKCQYDICDNLPRNYLRVYLQHCLLVCITKRDWLLSVLMFCNVDGNDLGALHYLNSWLGSWRGAFPPSSQLNSQPIRREDWDTPTNQSPGLAQVVGAGVGWGQFSWTLRPGCEVWTENFVFSFRPIWCRMFVACCKVNYRV